MAVVLHRLGYRCRQVVPAKPHKQRQATDALCAQRPNKRQQPSRQQGADAGASMGKPP
jgi:hypothetical protein